MRDKLLRDFAVFRGPAVADFAFAEFVGQRFVARKEFLHLHRIIGQRFGSGVDGGETASDDGDGQTDLEIGDGGMLGGAGELQRHEKIRGLADAAGEAVLHRNHRRPAGAGAERDVVEAEREGAVDGHGAAETHAAKHGEFGAALQEQADDLQEVLIPTNGDAVFGDAAETGHHAIVERFANLFDVAHRAERDAVAECVHAGESGGQRLDFQPVDAGDGVAVVHQMMGERETGGAEAHHQNLVAAGGPWHRTGEVQRVPTREQAVDFEAPGQIQNILERPRLDLRDVHRLLLLENAGLHAVVADAMAGAGHHRVIYGGDGERGDGVALRLHHVHLGDFLFERTAGEGDLECAPFELAGLLLQAGAAGVLALVVALDAVVRLIDGGGKAHAGVGKAEALTMASALLWQAELHQLVAADGFDRNEVVRVQLVRKAEQNAGAMLLPALGGEGGPGGVARGEIELRFASGFVVEPLRNIRGEVLFGERRGENGFQFQRKRLAVDGGG